MEKKFRSEDGELISSQELQYILDVNKKSIEINIEVEKQNEQVLENLNFFRERSDITKEKLDIILCENKNIREDILEVKEYNEKLQEDLKERDEKLQEEFLDQIDSVKKKIDAIEKDIFKLVIILGGIGAGSIYAFIQLILHK